MSSALYWPPSRMMTRTLSQRSVRTSMTGRICAWPTRKPAGLGHSTQQMTLLVMSSEVNTSPALRSL